MTKDREENKWHKGTAVKKHPIVYNQKPGVYFTTSTHLHFEADDGSRHYVWELTNVSKVSAGIGRHDNILGIDFYNQNRKGNLSHIFFELDTNNHLLWARDDIRAAVHKAKGEPVDTYLDMNTPSSSWPTTASQYQAKSDSQLPTTMEEFESQVAARVKREMVLHKKEMESQVAAQVAVQVEQVLELKQQKIEAEHKKEIEAQDIRLKQMESLINQFIKSNKLGAGNMPPSTANNIGIEMAPLMDRKQPDLFQDERQPPQTAFGDLDPEQLQGNTSRGLSMAPSLPDHDLHAPFGSSIFSLLCLHTVRSLSFWYSLFIYIFQMTTVILTLWNVVDLEYSVKGSVLQLPPMVDLAVTLSQGLALFMVIPFNTDLIDAVIKLQDGYYPELKKDHPNASACTWFFSCFAQLMAGLLLLFASLILTMQAEYVIDVMLNLTALLFLTEIDDLAFHMATLGFVTDTIQKEAIKAQDVQVPKRSNRGNKCKRFLYFVTLAGLFTAYGVIKRRQLRGDYLPTHVYIQFGVAHNAELSMHSGLFVADHLVTTSYRSYTNERKMLRLGYCEEHEAWVFNWVSNYKDGIFDCTINIFAMSSRTTSYDVASILPSEWSVKDESSNFVPFESISLISRDCNEDSDCEHGLCKSGMCVCGNDSFGIECTEHLENILMLCTSIVTDEESPGFQPIDIIPFYDRGYCGDFCFSMLKHSIPDGSEPKCDGCNGGADVFNASVVSDTFHILWDAETMDYANSYEMPVYYSNKTYPANVLFFSGRHWILSSEWGLLNLPYHRDRDSGQAYFPELTSRVLSGRDLGWGQSLNFSVLFLSDPVDFGTSEYKKMSPQGLGWWNVTEEGAFSGRKFLQDIKFNTQLTCNWPCSYDIWTINYWYENCRGWNGGQCSNDTGFCDCSQADETVYGHHCHLFNGCSNETCDDGHFCDRRTGKCRCNLPYYGENCSSFFRCFEEDGRCQNGGDCDMVSGACQCPDGFTGTACENPAE